MTPDELRLLKPQLKMLVDLGHVSQATMDEIASLTSAKPEEQSNRKLKEFVSRAEAARLLGVSEMTLIRWGQLGKLHPIKLAGRRLIRYKLNDIESLLNTAE